MIALSLDHRTLKRLQYMTGAACYPFLSFTLNFEDNTITDNLHSSAQNISEVMAMKFIAPMLCHYTMGNPSPLTGRLIKFRNLPGGYAYEGAFINRAVSPLVQIFGENPSMLVEAVEFLGGRGLSLGDVSAELLTLPGIPLTFILYGSDEFGASANILYDESAQSFLPTEDLAVLGELTVLRLIEAKKDLEK
ncbi:DUF3786 domain-containing protein [Candidatus Bathycorpusculum sp.]|uniref:DUF3786 domain-containing protein n=1 Tax=Candidatus Bathycorpusculum sp. TaxID=2994959 RepID=UPI00281BC61A|nr:DUF3786 domain-containing protein [Candidatus Termitimicrobium sp.]MCL2432462.1 DUF3786 domain-containing protein [Candidatus Termitimicrobium sp.]